MWKPDRSRLLFAFFLLYATLLGAQPRKTPPPLWKDGIYRSSEDFRANKPLLAWKETKGKWFYNPESGITTIAEIAYANGSPLSTDSIALICLNGLTALRIPPDSTLRSSAVYAKLQYPGRISYFQYEAGVIDTVAIAAYNPVSGKPFRQARLPRTIREYRERLYILETGKILPFSRESLLAVMDTDPEVRRAVSLLEDSEDVPLREKLLRAIEVFNERNPVKW